MLKKICLPLFYLLVLGSWGTSLTAEENEIAASLIKHLGISRGIIVSNSVQNFVTLKILSSRNVFTMTFDWNDFNKLNENPKVMVVVKIKNAAELDDFMQTYPNIFSSSILLAVFIPEDYINLMSNTLYIPIDNEFFAIYSKGPEYHQIVELYRIKNETNMVNKLYGSWSKKLGLSASNQRPELRRKNFQGAPLILKTENELPCSHTMECYQRQVWDDFSKILNFTPIYYRTLSISKKMFATHHPNPVPDAEARIKTLNSVKFEKSLIAPIMTAEVSFYIKHEINSLEGWSSLFKPFDKKLWIAVLIWLIMTTLLIIAIGYFQKLILNRFHLTEHLFIALDTITSQEGSENSGKISSRIATLALRITSSVIVPAYSAAIISFLTIQIPKVPFTDLYGFAQDGTYIIGSIKNSYPINLLLETKDPELSIIREKYMLPLQDMPKGHGEAYRRLCTENLAFLGYNNELHQYRNACKLLKIRPPLFLLPSGILLATDSPYRNMLCNHLVTFREAGILKILNKKLQSKDFEMKKDKKNYFRSINMNAVKTIILIGTTGVIISIFILAFELLWFHSHRINPDITSKFNII